MATKMFVTKPFKQKLKAYLFR